MADAGPLTRVDRRRLSDVIVDQVTDAIRSGQFVPGSRLPSERDLAQTFGVSRSLVREALRVLESLGLVEVRPGVGVIVAPHGLATAPVAGYVWKHPVEVLAVFEMREVVASRSTELAALRITPEEIAELKRLYSEQVALGDDAAPDRLGQLDRDFHNCIYQAAQNPVLYEMHQYLRRVIEYSETSVLTLPTRREAALAEHAAIIAALEANDSKRSAALMRAHIHRGTARLRELMERRIDRGLFAV